MRVWAAVRNHPGSTTNELLGYLKDSNRRSVSSALTVLEFNDVVYTKEVEGGNSPKKYFTELEKYNPAQASHHRYRNKSVNKTSTSSDYPSLMPLQPAAPAKNEKIESLFDTLTLNECRELYSRLHSIFG